jgi:hypothetical protein
LHYQQIIVALNETARIMGEIDKIAIEWRFKTRPRPSLPPWEGGGTKISQIQSLVLQVMVSRWCAMM